MGGNLSVLGDSALVASDSFNETGEFTSPLLKNNLEKIEEFYSSFKNICDNYTINLIQYEQIFSMDEYTFKIWDKSNLNVIDAFEIFSGLILFADTGFQDKVHLFFEIFDLNTSNAMNEVEIEFMISCILIAAFKIKRIQAEIDQSEVISFVSNNFESGSTVNFDNLFKWACKNRQVSELMRVLELPFEERIVENFNLMLVNVEDLNNRNSQFVREGFLRGDLTRLNSEEFLYEAGPKPEPPNPSEPPLVSEEVLSEFVFKLVKPGPPSAKKGKCLEKVALQYVVGFEALPVSKTLSFDDDMERTGVSAKLIYPINNLVVIFYTKLKKQDFFFGHKSKVTAIQVSSNSLVASAEFQRTGIVHLWDLKRRETIQVISKMHFKPITLLRFLFGNRLLVSVSSGEESSEIFFYDIENDKILSSFREEMFVRDILIEGRCSNPAEEKSAVFFFSEKLIICIKVLCVEEEYEFVISAIDLWKVSNLQPAQSMLLLSTSRAESPHFITGHKNGQILFWKDLKFDKKDLNHAYPLPKMGQNDWAIFCLTDVMRFSFFDLGAEKLQMRINFKKSMPFSTEFDSIDDFISFKDTLFLQTNKGDVFQYNLKYNEKHPKNKIMYNSSRLKIFTEVNGGSNFRVIKSDLQKSFFLYYTNREREINVFDCTEGEFVAKLVFGERIFDFCVEDSELLPNDPKFKMVVLFSSRRLVSMRNGMIVDERFIQHSIRKLIHVGTNSIDVVVLCQDRVILLQRNKEGVFDTGEVEFFFEKVNEKIYDGYFDANSGTLFSYSTKNLIYKSDLKKNSEFVRVSHEELPPRQYTISGKHQKYGRVIATVFENLIFVCCRERFYIGMGQTTLIPLYFQANIVDFHVEVQEKEGTLFLFARNAIYLVKLDLADNPHASRDQLEARQLLREARLVSRARPLMQEQTYFDSFAKLNYNFGPAEQRFDLNSLDDRARRRRAVESRPTETPRAEVSEHSGGEDEAPASVTFPPEHLRLKTVYGFDGLNLRNNAFFLHLKRSGEAVAKTNSRCERRIIYTVSKFVVIKNPLDHAQTSIYSKHGGKVMGLALMPKKLLVASVEDAGFVRANLHVWSPSELETLSQTFLERIQNVQVIKLSFDEALVFVLGRSAEGLQIVEAVDWELGEVKAWVAIQSSLLLALETHSHNASLFTVAGVSEMFCFEICGSVIKQRARHIFGGQTGVVVTSFVYYFYNFEGTDDYDYILGTRGGELGLCVFGNYKEVVKAHEGAVSTLKLIFPSGERALIISGSEDGFIKFWNSKLTPVKSYSLADLNRINFDFDAQKTRSFGPQSLDVHSCPECKDVYSMISAREHGFLLVGTRDNHLFEVGFEFNFKNLEEKPDFPNLDFPAEPVNSFKAICIKELTIKTSINSIVEFNNNSGFDPSAPRAIFAEVHPTLPVFISWGVSKDLRFFNHVSMKHIHRLTLRSEAVQVKFLGESNYFLVVDSTGEIQLFLTELNEPGEKSEVSIRSVWRFPDGVFETLKEPVSRVLVKAETRGAGDETFSLFIIFRKTLQKSNSTATRNLIGLRRRLTLNRQRPREAQPHELDTLIRVPLSFGDFHLVGVDETVTFTCSNIFLKFDHLCVEISKSFERIAEKKPAETPAKKEEVFALIFDSELRLREDVRPGAELLGVFPARNFSAFFEVFTSLPYAQRQKLCPTIAHKLSDRLVLLGTQEGFLLLASAPKFPGDQASPPFLQARAVAAHGGEISEIAATRSGAVLSSAREEPVLAQWEICAAETNYGDLRPAPRAAPAKSPAPRADVSHLKNSIEPLKKAATTPRLKLVRCIGRNAATANKGLSAAGKTIIYASGSLVCLLEKDSESGACVQNFLMEEHQLPPGFHPTEVDTFATSPNKQFLCVAATDKISRLFFWELGSKQLVQILELQGSRGVQLVRYSDGGENLVVVAGEAQRKGGQILHFLAVRRQASPVARVGLSGSNLNDIRCLEFLPGSRNSFLAAGLAHISRWTFAGGLLAVEELPFDLNMKISGRQNEVPTEPRSPGLPEPLERQTLAFEALIFINRQLFIAAGNDGCLYVFHQFRFVLDHIAHLREPILSLCASPENPNFFVSGGQKGCVNLWRIRNTEGEGKFNLELKNEYELVRKEESGTLGETNRTFSGCVFGDFGIQALQFRGGDIIAGCQNGKLFQLIVPRVASKDKLIDNKKFMVPLLDACDVDELLKSEISKDGQLIFSISRRGFFWVLELATLHCVVARQFGGSGHIIEMFVLKTAKLLVVVTESAVEAFELGGRDAFIEPLFRTEIDSRVNKACLSFNEEFLALSLGASKMEKHENQKVSIFWLCSKTGRLTFKGEWVFPVKVMDFSRDNNFLLYGDDSDKYEYVNLREFKKVPVPDTICEVEWVDEGQLAGQKAEHQVEVTGKITAIRRISERWLIVVQAHGTIGIFENGLSSFNLRRLYTQHLGPINACFLSQNRYLVTTGKDERNVLVWEILGAEETASQKSLLSSA